MLRSRLFSQLSIPSFLRPVCSRLITSWDSTDINEWNELLQKERAQGNSALVASSGENNNNNNQPIFDSRARDRTFLPRDTVLEIRRVAKVTTGGKLMRFRVVLVAGNENGVAGFGVGKASKITDAIRKARNDALNSTTIFEPTRNGSILHEVRASVRQTTVHLWPLAPGQGMRANNVVASLLQMHGVKDCAAKVQGSHNVLNTLLATRKALDMIDPLDEIALARGKRLIDLESLPKK